MMTRAAGETSIVLGLDIASRTGWCRYDGLSFETGVLDCTPHGKHEPEGARFRGLRAVWFQVVVRRIENLPDSVEIRPTVSGTLRFKWLTRGAFSRLGSSR